MITTLTRGIPQRVLVRFADLVSRCESGEDAAARTSLGSLAADCVMQFPEMAEYALAILAEDQNAAVRARASSVLRTLLERLDGLARIHVVVDWVLSAKRHRRVAMALALCSQLPILGVTPALRQLAIDEDPEVRQAACSAQRRRGGCS